MIAKINLSRKKAAINKVKEQKIIEINQEENNKKCCDCQSFNPQFISLYNGIFICEKCMNDIHKKLDSNISLILDNKLNNLTLRELQYLYYGGNKKLLDFINYEYPNLKIFDKSKLYLTRAMEYYRLWLKYLIDAGEKPVKPSFEESNELINDKKKIVKKENNNKHNIIKIDFLNNYYNYEDGNNFEIHKNNEYDCEKFYKTNYYFNKLNLSHNFSKDKKMNEINTSKNSSIDNDNNNNKSLNYNKIDFEKCNNNIVDNNKNKLIIKRLSNMKLNKNKTLNITKIEYESNLNKALNKILNKDKNKIYIKPKNTLLKSFQMNAPNKIRIETE